MVYRKEQKDESDNFTRFQTRERCALEIAAYVFKKCGALSCKLCEVSPPAFPYQEGGDRERTA